MRVITGSARGRRLETLSGNDVRPTTDVVKEAVFSIIQFYIEGRVFLDAFAGSGQMGIEAISRGAQRAYFIDSSRRSMNVIKKNIELCGFADKAETINADTISFLNSAGQRFDTVFLDPPYKKGLYGRCFELIRELELLSEDGIIVAEHKREDEFPEELEGFSKLKDRNYGTITLSVYCNLYKNV